jgi:hypothetical protein
MGELMTTLFKTCLKMTHPFSKGLSMQSGPGLPARAFIASLLCASHAMAAPAAAPAPASPTAAPAVKPSRYVEADMDAYISTLTAKLSITKRATDPFGQIQDPAAKPAPSALKTQTNNRTTPGATAKPLSEIVKQLKVTTVMPGEGKFLVGTRSISRGDSFPLVFQGKRYRVEVVEVSAQRILFRDVETEENGELRLDVMPQGMNRGIRGVLAPGMQPSKADAPLELDVPSSFR